MRKEYHQQKIHMLIIFRYLQLMWILSTDPFCNCCSPQKFKGLFLLIRGFILRKNSVLVEGIEIRLFFSYVKGTNSVKNSYQGSLLICYLKDLQDMQFDNDLS